MILDNFGRSDSRLDSSFCISVCFVSMVDFISSNCFDSLQTYKAVTINSYHHFQQLSMEKQTQMQKF